MKKEKLVLFALTALTVVSTGCARNFAGTYSGTEIVALSSVSTAPVNSATPNIAAPAAAVPTTATMTLTINQSSGTLLTGTWNSQGQSGTFQGNANGGDTITNVMLTMTGTPTNGTQQGMYGQMGSSMGYPGSVGYNPALQNGMCNTFNGTLTLSPNNQITGSLNVIQTAQTQASASQGYGSYGAYSCQGTRSINASKIN
jgi:hypothetical protein